MIIRKVSYFKRDKLRYIFQKIVIKICIIHWYSLYLCHKINIYSSYEYH
jgi:hypothetical protein